MRICFPPSPRQATSSWTLHPFFSLCMAVYFADCEPHVTRCTPGSRQPDGGSASAPSSRHSSRGWTLVAPSSAMRPRSDVYADILQTLSAHRKKLDRVLCVLDKVDDEPPSEFLEGALLGTLATAVAGPARDDDRASPRRQNRNLDNLRRPQKAAPTSAPATTATCTTPRALLWRATTPTRTSWPAAKAPPASSRHATHALRRQLPPWHACGPPLPRRAMTSGTRLALPTTSRAAACTTRSPPLCIESPHHRVACRLTYVNRRARQKKL